MEPVILDLIRTAGVGIFSFGTVIYLLRQSNEERRELTSKFINVLEGAVTKNTDSMNTFIITQSAEHQRILDAIERESSRRQVS